MPGTSPDSFSSTMRTKFGGVGASLEVTRSTNPDSDVSHVDDQLATSPDDAAIGRPSNAIGSLACAGKTSVADGSPRKRTSEWNKAPARSRAASASAWRSGRPTPLVKRVSPVKTAAASFRTNDVLSPVCPGVCVAARVHEERPSSFRLRSCQPTADKRTGFSARAVALGSPHPGESLVSEFLNSLERSVMTLPNPFVQSKSLP